MHFSTSSVVPAARGSVKVKNDDNGNYSVAVKVTHLAPADRLTPPKKGYFVWSETSDRSRYQMKENWAVPVFCVIL